MAREGVDDWVGYLDGMLERVTQEGTKITPHFWAYVAYTATISASRDLDTKIAVRSQIEALLRAHRSAIFEEGLRMVLETLTD
jgi:hypothetical protein